MFKKGNRLLSFTTIIVLIIGLIIIIRISRTLTDNHAGQKPEEMVGNITESINYEAPEPAFFDINEINLATSSTVKENKVQSVKSNDPYPMITARAFIVGNVKTGKILLEKNSGRQMPVASVSKLITAIITSETIDPNKVIEIASSSVESVPPDASGIGIGERFTTKEILYPLLINSSNIAAEALASSENRVKFFEKMSSYAWEVGMPQAFFADPSGVDPHNMASAKDVFALAQYLYQSRLDILAITRIANMEVSTTSEHGYHLYQSTHPFVNDSRFLGGKTGRTREAGETMLTILDMGGEPIAFIVLGSNFGSRAEDTRQLIKLFVTKL